MRLLLVNHEYPPVGGGAATATHALAHELSALGHEVAVLTAHYQDLADCGREGAVVVKRIRCVRRRADRSNLFEMLTFVLAALYRLSSVLPKHQPNALIIFFSLPSGSIGAFANQFFGMPYVVSLRGGDVPGLVPELNLIHKFLTPIRRFILKKAVAVVANSEGLRRLSQAADPISVRLIPNGVDADFFHPAPGSKNRQNRALRILFVGRFQEQKNLATLLDQLARLPQETFALHLVGDGPLKAGLQSLANRLGLTPTITWHGWLPRATLRDIYQFADCLVNPSLYEGMPNVVLEAMASGLPVIASNVPGNNDLVRHGETGFLFELAEPAGLISGLMQLRNSDLRSRMGEQARNRAVQFFSWRNVASQYLDLLAGADEPRDH